MLLFLVPAPARCSDGDTSTVKVMTQTGHPGFYSLKFSNDDRLLFSYNKAGEIHAWDPASLKQVRTYLGHSGELRQLWTLDQVIVTCNNDRFFIWDVDRPELARTITLFDSVGEYRASTGQVFQYGDRFALVEQHIDLPGDKEDSYSVLWKVDLLNGYRKRLAPGILDGEVKVHRSRPLVLKRHRTNKDTLFVLMKENPGGGWDTAWQATPAQLQLSDDHVKEPRFVLNGDYIFFQGRNALMGHQLQGQKTPGLFIRVNPSAPLLPGGDIFWYHEAGGMAYVNTGEWQRWELDDSLVVSPVLNREIDSAFDIHDRLMHPQWYDNDYYSSALKTEYGNIANHSMSLYAVSAEGGLRLYDVSGELLRKTEFMVASPEQLYVSTNGQRFIVVTRNEQDAPRQYMEWQFGAAFPLRMFERTSGLPLDIAASYRMPESDSVVTGSRYKVVATSSWHLSYFRGVQGLVLTDSSGKTTALTGHLNEVSHWAFNDAETLLASVSVTDVNDVRTNDIKVWKVEKGLEWKRMLDVGIPQDFHRSSLSSLSSSISQLQFSGDDRFLWGAYPGKLVQWELVTGVPVTELDAFAPFSLATGDSLVAAVTGLGQELVVYDIRSRAISWRFSGHSAAITSVRFINNNKHLLTAARDGKTKLWDLSKGTEVLSIVQFKDGVSYAMLTPGNYYLGSRESISRLNFVIDNKAYSYEQFDLALNRPDLVLSQVDATASGDLLKALYAAWQKRVRRMGLTEGQAAALPKIGWLPRATIQHAVAQDESMMMRLAFAPTAPGARLEGYQVRVNGIPVYPGKGKAIDKTSGTVALTDTLRLSGGDNEIQVYCFDDAGRESLRQHWFTNMDAEVTPRRIYIGIGVSKYADGRYNLEYPVKDVEDLGHTFGLAGERRFSATLLKNEEATRTNILALKQTLMATGPDDEVIISFNGHGVIDDKLNFYFATHDIDFARPEARGLSYNDISWLLDGIPSRKRLVLMDACHSGPIDTENDYEMTIDSVNTEGERSTIRIKNKTQDPGMMPAHNAFKLMQNLFTDISETNGAIVIAAAGGDEYALEGRNWKNGVFTYCVRLALEENAADKNADRQINIAELKNYVAEQVEKLTQGRQKPASRQDNPGMYWVLKGQEP